MIDGGYRQVIIPSKENHSINIPEILFGKKIEVIIHEVDNSPADSKPIPPPGRKIDVEELFENFGKAPDFPSIAEIRRKT
jgi:hypothetical protein